MDDIVDTYRRHPTKRILTKQMGHNIIMTLCGTNILGLEE
jgi:hypothetical protein